jgi:type II secretion system protein N
MALLSGGTMTNQQKWPEHKTSAERNRGKRIVLKYAKIIFVFFLLLSILLLIARPYKRIGRKIQQTLSERAPEIKIGAIDVRFPLRFTASNVEVPLKINHQQQRLHLKELKGNLSILPLLKGRANAEMKSDLLGGTVWLMVQSGEADKTTGDSLLVFDVRARQLDLQQVSRLMQASIRISGRCNADFEGTLRNEKVSSITGDGLCIANNVEVSSLNLDSLVLPANHAGEGKAKIKTQEGVVSIEDLLLTGSAYNISGTGTVTLKEPAEKSMADCSFGIVFKEKFTITDPALSEAGPDLVDALIKSKTKVVFTVTGPLGRPKTYLDPAATLIPLMKPLNQ